MPTADLVCHLVPIESLVEDPNNARLHPVENEAATEKALREFGQREPLVVRDGVVIGGNLRLAIMRRLGFTHVYVTVHDDLTVGQATALAIALNRTGELSANCWNPAQLAANLELVASELPDLDLGFTPEYLAGLELPELPDGPGGPGGGGGDGKGAGSLQERFLVPPFSVLDARQGYWQDRKRAWLALGIQSELGRGVVTWHMTPDGRQVPHAAAAPGGSLPPAIDRRTGRVVRGDMRGRPLTAPAPGTSCSPASSEGEKQEPASGAGTGTEGAP